VDSFEDLDAEPSGLVASLGIAVLGASPAVAWLAGGDQVVDVPHVATAVGFDEVVDGVGFSSAPVAWRVGGEQ